MTEKKKDLKIKLVRGRASADKAQSKVLDALGLKKTNSEVEHDRSPVILGMINKVSHLVEITNNK
jgi:large subunit ribosomal protein L30